MITLRLRAYCWILSLVLAALSFHTSALAQARYKVIEAGGGGIIKPEVQPVQLVEVRVAGSPVYLTRPFSADGDWLRTLTFKFRNVSERPISYVSIHLSLPETRSGDGGLSYQLNFGRPSGDEAVSENREYLMPGGEVELMLSAAAYEGFAKFVGQKMDVAHISRIRVGRIYAEMADGSKWSGSVLQRPVRIISVHPGKPAI